MSFHNFLVITPYRYPSDLGISSSLSRESTEEDAPHPFTTTPAGGWEEHDSYFFYFLSPVQSKVSLPAFSSCSLSPWEQRLSSTSVHLASIPGAAECQLTQGAPSPSSSPLADRYDYQHHMWLSQMVAKKHRSLPWGLSVHGQWGSWQLWAHQVPGSPPTSSSQLWPPAHRTVPRLPGQLIRKHWRCAASQIRDHCNSPVSNFLERNCSKPQSAGPKKVKPCDPQETTSKPLSKQSLACTGSNREVILVHRHTRLFCLPSHSEFKRKSIFSIKRQALDEKNADSQGNLGKWEIQSHWKRLFIPFVEFSFNHLSKTASKSWQYHTIMALQPSAWKLHPG